MVVAVVEALTTPYNSTLAYAAGACVMQQVQLFQRCACCITQATAAHAKVLL